jgi:hypothetical protein
MNAAPKRSCSIAILTLAVLIGLAGGDGALHAEPAAAIAKGDRLPLAGFSLATDRQSDASTTTIAHHPGGALTVLERSPVAH